MPDNIRFYNETLKKHIDINEVVEELVKYAQEKRGAQYKITVGTDSEGVQETQFVTASRF